VVLVGVFVFSLSHIGDPGLCENSRDHLVLAASDGEASAVRAFLGDGAKPTESDRNDRTPLYCASKNGHLDVVQVLLNAGADPNKYPDHTDAPLWIASREGRGPVVVALVGAHADPNVTNDDGPALLTAVSGRSESDDRYLLTNKSANDFGVPPQEPLTSPTRLQATQALLGAGAHRDGDAKFPSPLLTACNLRLPSLVDALLGGGADPNHPSYVSGSALDEFLYRSDTPPATAKATIPPGTVVGLQGSYYEVPPIFAAAGRGDAAIVARLLRAGADPNATALGGYRPLQAAALGNDGATIQELLATGATATPSAGVPSPLDLARQYDRQQAVEALSH
jgi:ankyrin repeat protein